MSWRGWSDERTCLDDLLAKTFSHDLQNNKPSNRDLEETGFDWRVRCRYCVECCFYSLGGVRLFLQITNQGRE